MTKPKATALTMDAVDEILAELDHNSRGGHNVRQIERSVDGDKPTVTATSLALYLSIKTPRQSGLVLLDLKEVLLQGFAEKDAVAVAAAIYLGGNPFTARATKRSRTPLEMADRDPELRPWSRLMRTAWAKRKNLEPSSIALIYGNEQTR